MKWSISWKKCSMKTSPKMLINKFIGLLNFENCQSEQTETHYIEQEKNCSIKISLSPWIKKKKQGKQSSNVKTLSSFYSNFSNIFFLFTFLCRFWLQCKKVSKNSKFLRIMQRLLSGESSNTSSDLQPVFIKELLIYLCV